MTNVVDPDQTAPIGAVCSGSMLFASIIDSSVMLGRLQQTTFSDAFFLGALRLMSSTVSFWDITCNISRSFNFLHVA